ncbi:predicted protein [Chaetomium globosum CBS 148.51]|uniref:Uncharacterized protein n=1 Tax=Chaetomium globosum (strain ATCC 6205 / CBS 148.51 / DSM 1962 / NBRC 6347 / NRRL 1970) TaxID=306901 RepID=Q2H4P1_CHAGB|nr:uncharacterized protein CHGG_06374 [Chaetomium globosum CBS 148.51]EAQ89755.1 predicted protein [Chaetomium globosum CBS 148.51]
MRKAKTLGIAAPTIKRIVRQGRGFEVIQTRIHGHDLMAIWDSIELLSTVRLAFQLRGMVRQMQTVTRPTAGSLGMGICRSFWIDNDVYGIPPHASPTTISSIVNFWHNLVSFRREDWWVSKGPVQGFLAFGDAGAREDLGARLGLFKANLESGQPCLSGVSRVRQPGWVLSGGLGAGMRVVRMPLILPWNSVFPPLAPRGDIYAGPWGSPSTAAVADPANTTLDPRNAGLRGGCGGESTAALSVACQSPRSRGISSRAGN